MEVEEGEGVHETVDEEKEKEGGEKEEMMKESKQEQEDTVGVEGIVGMIESKEPNDGRDVMIEETNVSNTAVAEAVAATTTTTALTLNAQLTLDAQISETSPGQNLAHDSHAITHESFFTAVIVPSCQLGNILCSARQHRYTSRPTKPISVMLFPSLWLFSSRSPFPATS